MLIAGGVALDGGAECLRRSATPTAQSAHPAGAAGILVGAVVAGHGMAALSGAAALTTVYLLVHLVAPTSMGAGDVKLAIGLGAVTGCFGAEVWFLAAIGGAAADRGAWDGGLVGLVGQGGTARPVDVSGQRDGAWAGVTGCRPG